MEILLIKDLCARLPYETYIEIIDKDGNVYDEVELGPEHINIARYDESISIRPYLRPMSSMTEEEKNEVVKLGVCYDGAFHNDVYDVGTSMEEAFLAISWLLERHFDINYLIEKGLALEAPKGMYNKMNRLC